MKPRLLVITSAGDKLMKALASEEWEIHLVSGLEDEHREFADAHLYDLALIEVDDLADRTWRRALRLLAESPKPCEAIICSRKGGEDQWAKVLEAGAFDLITEPYYPEEVHRIVRKALEEQTLQRLAHLRVP
jgi:DNA-binding response OmpR family regulator